MWMHSQEAGEFHADARAGGRRVPRGCTGRAGECHVGTVRILAYWMSRSTGLPPDHAKTVCVCIVVTYCL